MTPETPTVSPEPVATPSLVPTDQADPYWNTAHIDHKARVAEVQAHFQQAHGGPEPWREDGLERPSVADPEAPYVLRPAPSPMPPGLDDLKAVSNVFHAIGQSQARAQQALDFLENGPADRLPEPPAGYTPPDPSASLAELRRGWGAQAEENLRLAQAVVAVYDRQKGGAISEYLNRTGAGNDPRLIRLAARTGRQWLKAGWRP